MAEFRWYVAQALAGLEATAVYNLGREGITGYAPAAAKNRAAKVFPGYVFVELADVAEAGIVNRTRGIHRMLPIHSDAPLALPDGFIDVLRARVNDGEFDENAESSLLRRFLPGQDVTALGMWPLRDGHGRFLRHHKGAGIVLGYLFGREVEVRIPLHQLSPAGNGTPNRGRGASGGKIAA